MTTFKVRPDWAFITRKPSYFVAFGFGTGLIPWAPGTFGTLAAYPLFFLLQALHVTGWWLAALCVPLFAFGVHVSGVIDEVLGVHDHSGANFDEVVAMLLILAFAPAGWLSWGAAFVLFRFFDIVKPWPVSWLDRHVHGGFGVMIDDIAAALMALAALFVLVRFHVL